MGIWTDIVRLLLVTVVLGGVPARALESPGAEKSAGETTRDDPVDATAAAAAHQVINEQSLQEMLDDHGRAAFIAILAKLAVSSASSSSAPDYATFQKCLEAASSEFSAEKKPFPMQAALNAFTLWGIRQQPLISTEELAEFLDSKRLALRDVEIHYTVERTGKRLTPEWPTRTAEICDFAFVRGTTRLDASIGPAFDQQKQRTVRSYDGTTYRERRVDLSSKDVDSPANSVHKFDGFDPFFLVGNPLIAMGLIDSSAAFRNPDERVNHDFASLLRTSHPWVQEALVTIEGYECVAVVSFNYQLYLAMDLGFTPVRTVRQTIVPDPSAKGEMSFVAMESTTDYHDFREVIPGVWFPHEIAQRDRLNSEVIHTIQSNVLSCASTLHMRDSEVANIFPRGASVQDMTRNIVFTVGTDPSLAGTLDHYMQTRPRASRWILLAVNVLAIIVIALSWKRSAKRS